MTDTIVARVNLMFATISPWLVSNSAANLGEEAGMITWRNALEIASDRDSWLVTDISDACSAMCRWARETGTWDSDEIDTWTAQQCMALFVQNVASELSEITDHEFPDFAECVAKSAAGEYEYIGYYTVNGDNTHVDYCVGG